MIVMNNNKYTKSKNTHNITCGCRHTQGLKLFQRKYRDHDIYRILGEKVQIHPLLRNLIYFSPKGAHRPPSKLIIKADILWAKSEIYS